MFKHDIVSLIMARYNAVESFTNVQLGVRLTPLQKKKKYWNQRKISKYRVGEIFIMLRMLMEIIKCTLCLF